MNIKKLFKIGLINTLRLKSHYFGWGGVIHPVIVASRNLKINKLSGSVVARNLPTGSVQIGLGYVGIIDNRFTRAVWENSGVITFKGRTTFGPGTRICCDGNLTFEGTASINGRSEIICWNDVTIGDGFLMSWDCLLMDTDFHKIMDDNGKVLNSIGSIKIGDHVWIGCRSVILKNSTIPSDCVIAAGSTVSGKLTVGNAIYKDKRAIKTRINWKA